MAFEWLRDFHNLIVNTKDSFTFVDFIKYEKNFFQKYFRDNPDFIDRNLNSQRHLLDRQTQKIINEMSALCSKYNQEL